MDHNDNTSQGNEAGKSVKCTRYYLGRCVMGHFEIAPSTSWCSCLSTFSPCLSTFSPLARTIWWTLSHNIANESKTECHVNTLFGHGIMLCCVVLCYRVVLCCVVLCCIVLCCVVLCCVVLCCVVLCLICTTQRWHNTARHNATQNITPHTTTEPSTPHYTTPYHTTPHPEYSLALPTGWVPGAKPRTTGPGHCQ